MARKSLLLPTTLFVLLMLLIAGCAPAATAPANSAPAAPAAAATSTTAEIVQPATQAPSATNTSQPTDPTSTQAAASSGGSEPSTSGSGLVFTLVPEKSEARYKVREQLANHDLPNDAIGKTKQVSGSITVHPDGTVDLANSKFTVDLSTLATDQNMRDNYVRRNILQTGQYQYATFVPTSVSGLPNPLPTSGPVTFQITGDLTIRDVTKPVTWQVTGNLDSDQATGTATTSFKFEDFNIDQPRVPVVLSVVDNITLEVDLAIQKAQ